jgi:hypothetical protein
MSKDHGMATKSIAATFASRTGYVDRAPEGVAPATGHDGMMARMGRWFALLVAVSALALVLSGALADPAAARPNMGTVAERCTDVGGDPTVYDVLGMNFTYCDFGDGTGVWGID